MIRVGSISEGKLNISDKKYIDYSNSDIKSDFMDCFLLSKCEMFWWLEWNWFIAGII